VYGVACKRVDCRTRSSEFKSKPKSLSAFTNLIQCIQAPGIVMSFSDEGFLSKADIESCLSTKGWLSTIDLSYNRHIGPKIGVHNPRGEVMGAPTHGKCKEYIFVVTSDKSLCPGND
jgi:adenine-specific DNA-methyltransferase